MAPASRSSPAEAPGVSTGIEPTSTGARRSWLLKLLALLAVLAVSTLIAWRLGFFELSDREALAAAIQRARSVPWIVPLFVLIYALAAGVGLPASPLTLAGGAIFGLAKGTALNWTAAMIGGIIGYALARWLARDAFVRLLGRYAGVLDRLSSGGGAMMLLRLRLIPVVPFGVLNFGAGLVRLRFVPYVVVTGLGILPATVVYTYFADSLVSGITGAGQRAFVNLAIAAALLILLSFLPALARRMRGTHGVEATEER